MVTIAVLQMIVTARWKPEKESTNNTGGMTQEITNAAMSNFM